jgi:hypothetical protein
MVANKIDVVSLSRDPHPIDATIYGIDNGSNEWKQFSSNFFPFERATLNTVLGTDIFFKFNDLNPWI